MTFVYLLVIALSPQTILSPPLKSLSDCQQLKRTIQRTSIKPHETECIRIKLSREKEHHDIDF